MTISEADFHLSEAQTFVSYLFVVLLIGVVLLVCIFLLICVVVVS